MAVGCPCPETKENCSQDCKEEKQTEIPPKEEIVKPTCQNECSQAGLKRCYNIGNYGYQTCGDFDSDGCLEWSSVTICPSDTITCQDGICIQQGQKEQKCSDGTLFNQCSTNKPSYCENGNLINKCSTCGCPSGKQCQLNGSCTVSTQTTCQNECSEVGLKKCSNNSYQTCGNYDVDSCLEWSAITNCPPNTICQDGICSQQEQKCSDGTFYNQCSTNKPKYCDSGNLIDNCDTCGCPVNQLCQNNGSCCRNECSQVGLRGCSDNGYQTCGNYETDPCLEWSSMVSCPVETTCRRGNCIAVISPKPGVEYWAVVLSFFGSSTRRMMPLDFKNILYDNGWREDHIKTLTPGNVTYANLISALNWLASNSDSNDVVLFYIATHGTSTAIQLEDRFLEYSELAEKLNNISYGGMIVTIDACYSGYSIPYLQKDKRVIITSAGKTEASVIADTFSWALQGFGDVEGNNDNLISAEEIFDFVKRVSYPISGQQIQDDYTGELIVEFLNSNESLRLLDQYDIPPTYLVGGSFQMGALGGKYIWGDIAQSFKPSYPILTKVMLPPVKIQNNPGPLTVSIRKDLSGPDLTSVTLSQDMFSSTENVGMKFSEFDFSDIEVIPGETYYIYFTVPHAIEEKNTYHFFTTRNPVNIDDYTKGTLYAFYNRFSEWEPQPYDIIFATFGKPK